MSFDEGIEEKGRISICSGTSEVIWKWECGILIQPLETA